MHRRGTIPRCSAQRRRKSARLFLHLPRLWQDSPRLWRRSAKMSRKVENDGASPRERCRSPSQRGGIPVPPRLHTAPRAQDRGGTAGNWLFSSYVILHFLRTGVAPRGEVSNGVFALRLGKCFSALFFAMCTKKRGRPRFASAKLWPSSMVFNTQMWVFFCVFVVCICVYASFSGDLRELKWREALFCGYYSRFVKDSFWFVGAQAQ